MAQRGTSGGRVPVTVRGRPIVAIWLLWLVCVLVGFGAGDIVYKGVAGLMWSTINPLVDPWMCLIYPRKVPAAAAHLAAVAIVLFYSTSFAGGVVAASYCRFVFRATPRIGRRNPCCPSALAIAAACASIVNPLIALRLTMRALGAVAAVSASLVVSALSAALGVLAARVVASLVEKCR